ncbi:RNA polymerase II subunit 5-mediating protein homolog [Morus notabilis]|uniref:RNA polymerase II subunit 5-mediating protein homolog n=1 Tax=Morus notabilis TaxID=981085 RepID=UPI000CED7002|nr:RNA polymerase II subunit 5-mediating protein homolog [Morus notabilis]
MEGKQGVKGTVTALSSLYPTEEAQKAAKRVQDTIAEKQQELERLHGFISDNTNLINLVQRLPDNLHHDIMVPFGKAAFFPGRLVHTNEFLVLLGEGYYAETTSKKAAEILKRRGKALETQVDSLNAMMQDLKAEASFFHTTAFEAAEGIVEIREDYEDETSVKSESEPGLLKQVSSSFSEADNKRVAVEDKEFARIMSRMDELEKEELEADGNDESDEDEPSKADMDSIAEKLSNQEIRNAERPESRKPLEQAKNKNVATEEIRNAQHHAHQDIADQLNCTGLTVQSIPKGGISNDYTLASDVKKPAEKTVMPPKAENKVRAFTSPQSEVPLETPKPNFDSKLAFTGSIVEHADNIETSSRKQTPSQSSGSQPSKPVSRFKMHRR